MAKIWVNVTTEDGELLERERFEVGNDQMYPLGRPHGRTAVAGFVEDAARTVQAREREAQLIQMAEVGDDQ